MHQRRSTTARSTHAGPALPGSDHGPSRRPAGTFCAACWGAGRILTDAPNGEGLIPVRCAACDGRGTR